MKFKLNPFENSRTFFNPKGTNTTIIRDTVVNQTPTSQPEPVQEIEPEIKVKMSGEPTLDILAEEIPAPKTTKNTNGRSTKN
jgi:hypothetical protein